METDDIIFQILQERDMPMSDMSMREYIQFLIKGTEFNFAQIPANDKTEILLTELKNHGFISNDTQIEHFRVIFGIPLHKSKTPFEPIKWRKNHQLLRYFIYTLFPKETLLGIGMFAIPKLFANEHGEPLSTMPQSDKKRLQQSADYETLNKLLKEFNE